MAAAERGNRQRVLSALCMAFQVLLIPKDPAASRNNEAQRRSTPPGLTVVGSEAKPPGWPVPPIARVHTRLRARESSQRLALFPEEGSCHPYTQCLHIMTRNVL